MPDAREGLSRLAVALASAPRYPADAPFHPGEPYPEYPHGNDAVGAPNAAYEGVREAFRALELDAPRFGTAAWNPLGAIVRPGDRVLVKPNVVLHFNAGGGPLEAVVTHPSVVRAVVDYVLVALRGAGTIVVGDAPQANCDFDTLAAATGLDALSTWLGAAGDRLGVEIRVADFRREQTIYRRGIVWERRPRTGREPVAVRLGAGSHLERVEAGRLYGADHDRAATAYAHRPGVHEYLVAPELLEADVVVSVPKLKVHSKVGTTLNLKNMVGVTVDKNRLAHYRVGSPEEGGDEMAVRSWDDRVERALADRLLVGWAGAGRYPFVGWKAVRKALRAARFVRPASPTGLGNWHGNDTAWRMALDLNRIVLFARADGSLADAPVRRYVSVVDGIVGGEGEGPLHPDAVAAGVVLAGTNPLAVDWVATRAMGLDPRRIPLYVRALEDAPAWCPGFAVDDVRVATDAPEWKDDALVARFRPPAGWVGHIERPETTTTDPTDHNG